MSGGSRRSIMDVFNGHAWIVKLLGLAVIVGGSLYELHSNTKAIEKLTGVVETHGQILAGIQTEREVARRDHTRYDNHLANDEIHRHPRRDN